jgi:hypothetical protein
MRGTWVSCVVTGVSALALALVRPAPAGAGGTGATFTAGEGAPFVERVASFDDPSATGPATARDYAATIDWGDGLASDGVVVGPGTGGGFDVFGAHTYLDEGAFTFHVYITAVSRDQGSFTVTADGHVDVPDGPLKAHSCRMVAAGRRFRGAVASFVDADPNGNPGGNRGFVQLAYVDLLGRPADPVSLEHSLASLDGGTSRSDFATILVTSLEYRADFVRSLYTAYLHRPADVTEIGFGVSLMMAGLPTPDLEALILGSFDFDVSRTDGSDGSFIDAMYESVLGRPIDPPTHAALQAQLTANVKRSDVALGVVTSDAARSKLIDDLYRRFLDRAAGASEVAAGLGALRGGTSPEKLITSIVASDEFFARLTNFSTSIGWGDGTSSLGTVVRGPGGEFEVHGAHTYGPRARAVHVPGTSRRRLRVRRGRFPVTVIILDGGGSQATVGGEMRSGARMLGCAAP